ncbi:MAG TPA: hypothetical protein VGB51_04165 [Actinomycetota bacterium]
MRPLKLILGGLLGGALALGAATAGTLIAPTPDSPLTLDVVREADPALPDEAVAEDDGGGGGATAQPGPGQVLAGAAAVSITPQPDASKGEVWAKDGCIILGEDAPDAPMHVADFRSTWPENPNCIYSGGYGIGPMNPIYSIDPEFGLWVRSAALGDGTDTIVVTIIDGTSYFGDYAKLCDDCGAFDIAATMGTELSLPPSAFVIGSTHSHTAPDFIGGWGAVPQWYMDQVEAAIKASIRTAVGSMEPAVLEAGETLARQFNGERRDTYRSAEETFLTYFRALEVDDEGDLTGQAIATVGAYAAHPVTADESKRIGDADYPGVFERRVEERFGGVGLIFPTGLGNMSPRGNKVQMGDGLAGLLPEVGQGSLVSGTDVRSGQTFWDQPVTNSGLTALGVPGFFDRPFAQSPATVTVGKSANKPCRSASPISVRTAVSVAKVGDLTITAAPGEVFANLTNTLKERSNGVVMPLAQANDGLGYIMQSFETDHAARQVLGFAGEGVFEYEDAYSIDACFGDMVLESTIALMGSL